jgi:hypothetical protein
LVKRLAICAALRGAPERLQKLLEEIKLVDTLETLCSAREWRKKLCCSGVRQQQKFQKMVEIWEVFRGGKRSEEGLAVVATENGSNEM